MRISMEARSSNSEAGSSRSAGLTGNTRQKHAIFPLVFGHSSDATRTRARGDREARPGLK
jgi:hypothetical protein